jgi:hypothetical protein
MNYSPHFGDGTLDGLFSTLDEGLIYTNNKLASLLNPHYS